MGYYPISLYQVYEWFMHIALLPRFNGIDYYYLVQSTISEPLSSHQSISLSSFPPPVPPRGASSPFTMRIHNSPSVPRGTLNNFINFRHRMRRGADGNTLTVWVKASAVGIDGGGLTDERLALISEGNAIGRQS